jgi:hypothetical protein
MSQGGNALRTTSAERMRLTRQRPLGLVAIAVAVGKLGFSPTALGCRSGVSFQRARRMYDSQDAGAPTLLLACSAAAERMHAHRVANAHRRAFNS